MALIQAPTATGLTNSQSSSYDTYLMGTLYDTLAAAKGEANTPYQAYTGQRIAGFSPDELQSFQQTRDLQGAQQPLYNQANSAITSGMAGLANLNQMPSQFGQQQLDQYMNPYITGVVNSTTENALRTHQQELNRLRGSAGLAGAFGGSRQAIGEQELFGNTQRNLNSTISDLYNTGYGQALDQFNKDRQFGIDRINPNLQMAQGASNLAENQQANTLKGTEALYNSGSIQRNLAQTGLDTAYQDFTNQRDYNKNQIGFLSNLVNGANVGNYQTGTTQTQANTYPKQSTLNSILGGLSTGLGFLSNAGVFGSSSSATEKAKGGLVEGYAEGGHVAELDREKRAYQEWVRTHLLPPDDATSNAGNVARALGSYPGILAGGLGSLAFEATKIPAAAYDWLSATPGGNSPQMASAPTGVATQPFVPARYDYQFGPPAPSEEDMVQAQLDQQDPRFQGILSGLTGGGAKSAQPSSELGYNQGQQGGGSSMADLFPNTDTPMDKMFEMNPMIAMGLGLLGASGNPNSGAYQIASGVGNALETYEGMKNARQQAATQKGSAVSEAMSRNRTGDYNEGMLEETKRANTFNQQFKQQQLDQAYELAMSKAQAGIRINPQIITSYNNYIAKQAELGNVGAAQEAVLKRDQLLEMYLSQGGDPQGDTASDTQSIYSIDTDNP